MEIWIVLEEDNTCMRIHRANCIDYVVRVRTTIDDRSRKITRKDLKSSPILSKITSLGSIL